MQEHLFRNFYSKEHESFLKYVTITLIDKTDSYDPNKRENYWIRTLRNLAPDGLNIEESV